MKIRALSLTSKNRITEIREKYRIQTVIFPAQNYLFELTEITSEQRNLLNRFSNLLKIYVTSHTDTLLISVDSKFFESEIKVADPELSQFIYDIKDLFFGHRKPVWNLAKEKLDFNDGPFIMGILNVTPDSFYDGARYNSVDKAVDHALKMAEDGARIIDIGGESTRPGAETVTIEDELKRVIPVIREINKQSNVLISIDTYKSEVAQAAIEAGADIVNDISGSGFDKKMIPLIKATQCPYIIMHIKGTPKNMQLNPHYDDTLQEIYRYFEEKLQLLYNEDIKDVMIDPGIGFGKRLQDNLRLIRDLNDFTFLKYPILVGASRKSLIGQVLGKEKEDRLNGSLAIHLQAAINGADVVRTHDVKETSEILKIYKAINNPN